MPTTEQPTTDRVQFLLTKVMESRDREVLYRLQAELTSGARHNEGDVNAYAALWHTHGDKDAARIDYGTSVRTPQPKPQPEQQPKQGQPEKEERDAKHAPGVAEHGAPKPGDKPYSDKDKSNPPDPYTHEVKPQGQAQESRPQDKSNPKR